MPSSSVFSNVMLVIVHYRDIQLFFKAGFYFKAFGRLDIFKVDTSKSRGNGLYCFDKLFRIFFIDFNVENVNTRIYFK